MPPISPSTNICGIIGHPLSHTLSPAMHNAAYKALNLDYVYLAFPVTDLASAIQGIRAFNLRGISVTIPYKQDVLSFLDEIDPVAEKIGAVNTIVNDEGKLTGYNTDWEGCMEALKEHCDLQNKRVAVLGAGGAARAIVYGLLEYNCDVTLYNRTLSNAVSLAQDTNTQAVALDMFQTDHNYDIIIHTTSLGMHPHEDVSPLPQGALRKGVLVHDIVYNPQETKLLKEARDHGCDIVYGYKMLLFQGVKQFELFTGKKAPVDVMENALLTQLQPEG